MKHNLEEIYKQHAKSVYKYLLSLSHSQSLAEELTQETFYRAVYSIHRYNGSCKMAVWLCQIAKHVWYQYLAKNTRAQAEELREDLPSAAPTPEESALARSEKIALYRAINALGEPMREVMYLRLTGEFSFAEIGEVFGKSEGWARVTFYRAKQKIIQGDTP